MKSILEQLIRHKLPCNFQRNLLAKYLRRRLHFSVFSVTLIVGVIFSIFWLETNVSDHLFGF